MSKGRQRPWRPFDRKQNNMARRMVYAERFIDDASRIWSEGFRISLVNAPANVEEFMRSAQEFFLCRLKKSLVGCLQGCHEAL